ncbi:TonB-dependent siderophore receptor [Frateuria aurantia]
MSKLTSCQAHWQPGRKLLPLLVIAALSLPAGAYADSQDQTSTLEGTHATAQDHAGAKGRKAPVADKKKAVALGAVTVAADDPHSYTVRSTPVSTGLDLSLRETPQTVTVISRQQMDDENIQTLDDVLSAVPGVSSFSYDNSGRTTYRARGFDITNYRIDGMLVNGSAALDGQGEDFNMDLYENVQVVMGANGLMGGTGDPSATIYLQRKLPTETFGINASVTTGSWDKKRAMVDLNMPLTKDGRIRSRLVVSDENSGTFRERESVRRLGVLGSVAADLTSSTTLTLGVEYNRTTNNGASWGTNVPIWYADGSRTHLSRSTNPVADWSVAKRSSTTWFGSLIQQLPNDWHLNLSFSQSHSDVYDNLGIAKVNNAAKSTGGYAGFWNEDGTGAYLNALHAEYSDVRTNIDFNASGPFQLFGREHQLVVGFSGYKDDETTYTFSAADGNCSIDGVTPYSACQYRATGLPIADWQTWDGSYAGFKTHRTYARTVDTIMNYGLYTAAHFNLADRLKLILGGRISNYRTRTTTFSLEDVRTRSPASGNDQVWTPYAGLLFDLDQHHTLYASYTSVFNPQGDDRDANNNILAPATGKSYEAGIKGAYFHDRLNTSIAYFTSKQNGVAESTGLTNDATGETIYRAVNGVKAQGVELSASGRIGRSWNIMAGYTYTDTQGLSYREDPRNLFKVFTTYRLPGAWHRLSVGGGVTIEGTTQWTVSPGRPLGNGKYDTSNVTLGGYTLVNLMANYEISRRFQVGLNIANLTNKVYYTQFGFYDGLIYGAPRSVMATFRFKL